MKVLVCDKFEESGLKSLQKAQCEVVYRPETKTPEDLTRLIQENQPSVLVVRSTKISEAMVKAAPSLQLIVRAGAGVNTIDVAACSKAGIYVSNCPGKNSIAVAELAFGLITSLDRRIPDNTVSLREGKWNKKEFSKARGLYGRTLGIIGIGNIGFEMIERARAFGMKVVAWSRNLTPEKADALEIDRASSLEDLAKKSTIISIHVALKKETQSILNRAFFEALPANSILVNTSRAEVIEKDALAWAIKEKGLRYGTDVYWDEPTESTAEFSDPFIKSGAYGTHHIGASTEQAQEAIAAETVRIIESFKSTGEVPNAVNLAKPTVASHCLTVRHLDRPGVLASVLTELRNEKINVQEMENIIFEGAQAAIARINLDSPPSSSLLKNISGNNPDILNVSLFQL